VEFACSSQTIRNWLWERLTARAASKNLARIRLAAGEDPAALFAFDLLWLSGADFRPRPLAGLLYRRRRCNVHTSL
jgi:ATP-dependent DNA ligase